MSALLFAKDGPLVTLTINRPESRNPLGEEGDGALFADAAARINEDREVRAVILTGAGSAFSAGGNVKSMRDKGGAFSGPGVAIRERRTVHVLLAKCDKLKRAEQMTVLREAQRILGSAGMAQLFSAHAGTGVEEAQRALVAALRPEVAAKQ